MSALAKEVIFEELRQYHQVTSPSESDSGRWVEIKKEFSETEDTLITMLIRLVNGKESFVESKDALTDLQDRVTATPTVNEIEQASQAFYVTKVSKLQNILSIARQTNFPLRKLRIKNQHIVVTGKKV